ncbi:5-formyltetrahydrofolate cyclo-ligase [Methylobacterium sp. Leaf117]|uniref:5-formyltetrahydrofolate cyclo-ligase n=1 Tax=Methylobacterium sp. Leaf117 TaxID=1736260 RepID=UPI0009E6CB9D|nr:5-formyltetrahydrofolate cyclo-ligase [Methylobacterium sp. Leaf117]
MAGRSAKPPDQAPGAVGTSSGLFNEYSSPPCFMHELDESFLGLGAEKKPASRATSLQGECLDWAAVRQWRKDTRAALIDARVHIAAPDRAAWSARIGQSLEAALLSVPGKLVGFYWPFRGEFDARPVLTSLRERGVRLALPVVEEKAQPLQFREWWPGISMTRGVWNIPIPTEGDAVGPDVLIAPLVGFDSAGFRLGYGGGFYDRTIAHSQVRPLVIGVGFELACLPTIHPQAHDVAMDLIITEAGAKHISSAPLRRSVE